MGKSHYWIYILKCSNGNYYTGYTTDLARRYAEHQQGTTKCKYTRSFKPLGIAQSWQVEGDKALAMRVERLVKGMTKRQKEQLIEEPERLWSLVVAAE